MCLCNLLCSILYVVYHTVVTGILLRLHMCTLIVLRLLTSFLLLTVWEKWRGLSKFCHVSDISGITKWVSVTARKKQWTSYMTAQSHVYMNAHL